MIKPRRKASLYYLSGFKMIDNTITYYQTGLNNMLFYEAILTKHDRAMKSIPHYTQQYHHQKLNTMF